jgi:membrane-anchored glycerophosphoryl diester phosphodiesterase (GDPDase)
MKLKIKQDTLFIVIGILLLLSIAGLVFYSINFLLKNTRDALDQESLKAKEITRFNLEGLKKLGIMK